jgi:hypothetical protein
MYSSKSTRTVEHQNIRRLVLQFIHQWRYNDSSPAVRSRDCGETKTSDVTLLEVVVTKHENGLALN